MELRHRHLFHTWATLISKGGPCMKQVSACELRGKHSITNILTTVEICEAK